MIFPPVEVGRELVVVDCWFDEIVVGGLTVEGRTFIGATSIDAGGATCPVTTVAAGASAPSKVIGLALGGLFVAVMVGIAVAVLVRRRWEASKPRSHADEPSMRADDSSLKISDEVSSVEAMEAVQRGLEGERRAAEVGNNAPGGIPTSSADDGFCQPDD